MCRIEGALAVASYVLAKDASYVARLSNFNGQRDPPLRDPPDAALHSLSAAFVHSTSER